MIKGSFEIDDNPEYLLQHFFHGRKYSRIAVLTDTNTSQWCYHKTQPYLPSHQKIEVPAGEENKTLATCTLVWEKLTQLQFDRHDLLVVLGGGVLGDLGGFCAATYKRGIDFVLMPTTLLAQVDASIGGKLGIDFHHYKNHIGLFCEPSATLICPDFLSTLPERELRSGFAEVIKHCLISDQAMWQKVKANGLHKQNWSELIQHSADFKKSVVTSDPLEKGLRKILNFGHTMGHACESYFLSEGHKIYHGEAVAMGMIMESHIACQKKMLSQEDLDSISNYLLSVFGKVNNLPAWTDLQELIYQDKKNKGNEIRMALLRGIGEARWDIVVSEKEAETSLEFYRSLHVVNL